MRVARAVRYESELERKLAKTLEESSISFGEKIAATIAAWEKKQESRRRQRERRQRSTSGK
jgi:hypothetical protein